MSLDRLRIETERLILRPFTEKDIPAAYKMNLDRQVSKYTGDGGIVSLEEIDRRIREDVLGDYDRYGYGRLAVVLKKTGRFMGFAGLKYLSDLDAVDLGYRFKSEYWGKGYATEAARACLSLAFDTFGLEEVIASVQPENAGSIRVLQKLEFIYRRTYEEDGLIIQEYARQRLPITS